MKNRELKAFRAAKGGKTRKDQKMKIFYSELNQGYQPNMFALDLLNDTMPDWVYPTLRLNMAEALEGYNEEVALEMVDNLIDCWSGLGLHVTGLKYVDKLLGELYMRILACAHDQGIKLMHDK